MWPVALIMCLSHAGQIGNSIPRERLIEEGSAHLMQIRDRQTVIVQTSYGKTLKLKLAWPIKTDMKTISTKALAKAMSLPGNFFYWKRLGSRYVEGTHYLTLPGKMTQKVPGTVDVRIDAYTWSQ